MIKKYKDFIKDNQRTEVETVKDFDNFSSTKSNNRTTQNDSNNIKWYGIISGTVFMIIIIIIALSIKCPTDFQRWVFRVSLSIAIASYASIIPGFLKVKYQGFISAGGALAVFVLVFLVNPELHCEDYKLKGIVFVDNKIQKHVDVRLLEFRNSAVTDEYGSFEISIPAIKKIENTSCNFVFNYMDYIDTTVTIEIKDIEQIIYFILLKKSLPIEIIQKDNLNKTNKIKILKYIVGKIVDKVGKPMENIKISYLDKACRTNVNGYFKLQIPDNSPEQIQFQVRNSNGESVFKSSAINIFNTFKFN